MNIKGMVLAFGLLLSVAGGAQGREAREPGYGKPPTYSEALLAVMNGIGVHLRDPASVQGFAISRPYAACMDRGHPGRADVCGYRMCAGLNAKNGFGGYVGYTTWTVMATQRRGVFVWQGSCSVATPWIGDPPVDVRDFCADNPKHSACKSGEFSESFVAPTLAESTAAPDWIVTPASDEGGDDKEVVALCSDEFKDQLRAKGMSYKDIADVCRE